MLMCNKVGDSKNIAWAISACFRIAKRHSRRFSGRLGGGLKTLFPTRALKSIVELYRAKGINQWIQWPHLRIRSSDGETFSGPMGLPSQSRLLLWLTFLWVFEVSGYAMFTAVHVHAELRCFRLSFEKLDALRNECLSINYHILRSIKCVSGW